MTSVGVDWASGLWVTVAIDGDDVTITAHPSILNVWHAFGDSADAVLVDIPIGLPEDDTRACDRAAQAMLADRSSTVFPVPARSIVETGDYGDAAEAAGGSLGSQSWWLFPRIREVDVFLQEVDGASDRVYESHPEVCFAVLAGEPLPSKDTADGVDERVDILDRFDCGLHAEVRRFVENRRENADWHHRISKGRSDGVATRPSWRARPPPSN